MAAASNKMNRTKTIALLGLMLSLTIIFCFVPIKFGPITLALMILPTLIVAQVCGGWISFAMGLIMGLLNYIAWFTTKSAEPLAPVFQNPLVCILPRVLIAIVAYWSRRGLEFLILKKGMKIDINPQPVVDDEDNDADDQLISVEETAEPADDAINDEIAETPDENSVFDTQSIVLDETAQSEDAENIIDDDAEGVEDPLVDEEAEKKAKRVKTAKVESARQAIHLLSTALGVLTNTLFVGIFTLLFFNHTTLANNTIINVSYVLGFFSINFGVEIVVFSLITPPIALAIRAAKLVK